MDLFIDSPSTLFFKIVWGWSQSQQSYGEVGVHLDSLPRHQRSYIPRERKKNTERICYHREQTSDILL